MLQSLDRFHWGKSALDPSPPVKEEDESAKKYRELALRCSLSVLSHRSLSLSLQGLFEAPKSEQEHSVLVRFLSLSKQLTEQELPLLRKAIRAQNQIKSTWTKSPSGGRIDTLSTIQNQLSRTGSTIPSEWKVQRTERLVDTPVNRLVSAILRQTHKKLSGLVQRMKMNLRVSESFVINHSLHEIEALLQTTPLGLVPKQTETILVLKQRALPWRIELERIRSLIDWWDKFQVSEVTEVYSTKAEEKTSVFTCYELVCVLSLLLSLHEVCVGIARLEEGVLHFQAREKSFRLSFGSPGKRYGRKPTAIVQVRRQEQEVCYLVEARNFQEASAEDLFYRMDLFCETQNTTQALIATPQVTKALLFMPSVPQNTESAWVKGCSVPITEKNGFFAFWSDFFKAI